MFRPLRDEWCVALRSGRYAQAQGRLKRDKNYCVLGVLCDLLPTRGSFREDYFYCHGECAPVAGDLPEPIRQYAGLDELDVAICIELNDAKLMSFAQIADWIEENL